MAAWICSVSLKWRVVTKRSSSFLFVLDELSDEAKSEDVDGLRVLTVHKYKRLRV